MQDRYIIEDDADDNREVVSSPGKKSCDGQTKAEIAPAEFPWPRERKQASLGRRILQNMVRSCLELALP